MEHLTSTAAVVVHHRSQDTLLATLNRLLDEGLLPGSMVVMDNGERPLEAAALSKQLPAGIRLVEIANQGYGAAVNAGVAWLRTNAPEAQFILVSTHESLPHRGALRQLEVTLSARSRTAVVGPVLVTGTNGDNVWSRGGTRTRWLGLPSHLAHNSQLNAAASDEPAEVSWLDGAFLLFRREALEQVPLDERFFLYMEETDHHHRLRRQGWDVVIDPGAVVWQSSNGVPPYYLARNIQLFLAKNGHPLQRMVAAPYLVLRTMARDLVQRRDKKGWADLVKGLRDGRKYSMERPDTNTRVTIINPLGAALAHYTGALAEVLRGAGAHVQVTDILEPSASGEGRLRWLTRYLQILASARASRGKVLVVWPVLGFLDMIVAPILAGRGTSVVYHDPKPLVSAVGTGKVAAKVAALAPFRADVIVHSNEAATAMKNAGLPHGHLLEHPMYQPIAGAEQTQISNPVQTVRVLGQYKRDRDLDTLVLLGEALKDFRLEIVGRGWPDVAGWTVDARFVSEAELDDLIRSSGAVLIPYNRFYQSGIAMRALELGVPVVGRAETSLAGLYGHGSRLLVSGNLTGEVAADWIRAVRYASAEGRNEALAAGQLKYATVLGDWKQWQQLRATGGAK